MVTEAFANLIKELWLRGRSSDEGKNVIKPIDLIKSMSQLAPQFSQNTQEDAHEFLAFLLDIIHEDLNRVK